MMPAKPCPGLGKAEFVFVRRDASHGPLQMPYTGPYRVLERHEKFFKLRCGEREEAVSVDRLKPAYSDPVNPIQPAVPPRRGRPPKRRDERTDDDRQDTASTVPVPDQRPVASESEQAASEPASNPTPPSYAQVTRRGRQVRPPQRYVASVATQ